MTDAELLDRHRTLRDIDAASREYDLGAWERMAAIGVEIHSRPYLSAPHGYRPRCLVIRRHDGWDVDVEGPYPGQGGSARAIPKMSAAMSAADALAESFGHRLQKEVDGSVGTI